MMASPHMVASGTWHTSLKTPIDEINPDIAALELLQRFTTISSIIIPNIDDLRDYVQLLKHRLDELNYKIPDNVAVGIVLNALKDQHTDLYRELNRDVVGLTWEKLMDRLSEEGSALGVKNRQDNTTDGGTSDGYHAEGHWRCGQEHPTGTPRHDLGVAIFAKWVNIFNNRTRHR